MAVDVAPELPLLEVLEAAPNGAITEGRVEATGLLLVARDLLTTADHLRVMPENGAPASSPQLVEAIFSCTRRGLVERRGMMWRITTRGRAVLREAGVRPSDEARRIAAQAAQ